jgi:hypothetical protein
VKPRIFISYSRRDARFAEKLRLELKRAELGAWLDVDRLAPGTEWQPKLLEALRTANALVVCVSRSSANSAYVTFEWSYAMGAGVRVFPVVIKETALHPVLSRIQWIDLSGRNPPWDDLIKALKTVPRSRRNKSRNPEKPRAKMMKQTAKPMKAGHPTLFAEFELDDNGKPIKIGPEYSIGLRVKNAPPGTKSVSYELHDESFDEPRFRVNDEKEDFEAWISSYGDVPVSARGKTGKHLWRTKEMLGRALRRGHGSRASGVIKRAIAKLEKE